MRLTADGPDYTNSAGQISLFELHTVPLRYKDV